MCDLLTVLMEMGGKVIAAATEMGAANFWNFIKDLPYDKLIDFIFEVIGKIGG